MKQMTHKVMIALIGGTLLMVGLIIALMIETHFFVQQARELNRLKKDYDNYTLALKRMIARQTTAQPDDLAELKKKSVNEDEFLIVNRDFEYLVRSAVKHAQKHRMAETVQQLYQIPGWRIPDQPRRTRRPLRRKTQSYAIAIDSDIMAMRNEHRFIVPLDRGTYHISSRFGPRKRANGSWGFHYGLDMAAPRGTPVKAAAQGVVVEAHYTNGFGNMVLISHSNKLKTRYAHLSKIDVKPGQFVEQGHCVGRVGNTGYTRGKNGVHLHFEVLVYGKQINPTYFL